MQPELQIRHHACLILQSIDLMNVRNVLRSAHARGHLGSRLRAMVRLSVIVMPGHSKGDGTNGQRSHPSCFDCSVLKWLSVPQLDAFCIAYTIAAP